MMKGSRLSRSPICALVLLVACDGDSGRSIGPEMKAFLSEHRDPRTWETLDDQRVQDLPRRIRDPRTGIVFVLVPAGEFEMGGNISAEQPVHRVRVSRPFYMGEAEVTAEQWRRFVSEHGGEPDTDIADLPADHPVSRVSWHDAQAFCTTYGYALPTEAEWEYACAGNAAEGEEFWTDPDRLAEHAWIGANGGRSARPVRSGTPNGFGLYDTIGNVWEWCADRYADGYQADPDQVSVDPRGPATGPNRVLRGGSWFTMPAPRPTDRGGDLSGVRNDFCGFRVICRVNG